MSRLVKEQGIALLEAVIAAALGIIVILALLSLFLGVSKASLVSTEQEYGKMNTKLQQLLSKAGYEISIPPQKNFYEMHIPVSTYSLNLLLSGDGMIIFDPGYYEATFDTFRVERYGDFIVVHDGQSDRSFRASGGKVKIMCQEATCKAYDFEVTAPRQFVSIKSAVDVFSSHASHPSEHIYIRFGSITTTRRMLLPPIKIESALSLDSPVVMHDGAVYFATKEASRFHGVEEPNYLFSPLADRNYIPAEISVYAIVRESEENTCSLYLVYPERKLLFTTLGCSIQSSGVALGGRFFDIDASQDVLYH